MDENDNRDLSDSESKWIRRLKTVINAMPPNIEVTFFSGGSIAIHNLGATDRYFNINADVDNVDEIDTIFFNHRVSKRIKGKDCQI